MVWRNPEQNKNDTGKGAGVFLQPRFSNFWRNEMNLQQLKYIVEIADCHSITKASQKLFVSQPYLSKVVSDFEAG